MCLLDDYHRANAERIDIMIIYINEAHAADVWNIGKSAGTMNNSHKEIADRINCSLSLRTEFNSDLKIYCDNMNNDFETTFAAWPVRFFVIKRKKIKLISEVNDSEINICDIIKILET